MSEQLRESLSAAVDDEADAFELRRVLDEAKQNDDLREQWHRYHLIRDLLREDVRVYHPGLRDAIWEEMNQRIDDEESIAPLVLAESVVGDRQRSPWLGRIIGTSVAAAVAVVVMFNGGVFERENEFVKSPQLAQDTKLAPVMYQQATSLDQQRQHALMLHHIQQRAMNSAGVASFVKLATFSTTVLPQPAERVSAEDSSGP